MRQPRRSFTSVFRIAMACLFLGGSAARAHDLPGDLPHHTGVARPAAATEVALLQTLLAELRAPEDNDLPPAMAGAFAPFKDQVKVRWDERWLYVESNGMPAHNMMVGITAWQQHVPLPKDYTGKNAWQIPLHPVPSKNPVSIKGKFLRGAIAVAANGIPIFNPQNNRGEVSAMIGELDQWGGHCGRGDDYHYHAAPIFLEKTVGPGKPIAFALDGYPIYGTTGSDGLPVDEKTLDEFHGRTAANGDYAYYASTKYPYVNGGFHGEVTEIGEQVDPQPSARGPRAALAPLRGAHITAFTRSKDDRSFSLKYEIGGETCAVNYAINADSSVKFDFVDGRGQVKTETYPPRGGGRGAGNDGGERPATPADPTAPAPRAGGQADGPSVKQPFTDHKDGTITDNFTGLMWQKVDNGESTWEKAATNAPTLRLAGHDDWRLPTLAELFSVTNHNANPAIDLNFFPSNPTHAAEYWWTADAPDPDRAWVVNRGGGTGNKPKNETLSAGGKFSYDARYVRGPRRADPHTYVDNQDETVTDADTGLMWAKSPAASMNWESAIAYAKGARLAGHADWRLPDVKELATLLDYSALSSPSGGNGKPCINRAVFPDAKAAFYWTSTPLRGPSATQAWYVDFESGSVRHQALSSTSPLLLVRTAAAPAAGSTFHPEDTLISQPPDRREAGGADFLANSPGGSRTPAALRLLPREVEERLALTDPQRQQIDELEKQAQITLKKILTPEQLKILEESRPRKSATSPPPRPSNGD